MFARSGLLSLALALFSSNTAALELDVNSQDSIKSAAKSLASSIVSFYDLKNGGVPGLLPDPHYFWEAGNFFTELIEYGYLTGDSQYNDIISEGLQFQLGENDAFLPPNQTKNMGNDDQSFWGLASLTAHEAGLPKPAKGEWIQFAINVWETQSQRWDDSVCNGGLRWQIFSFNAGYSYMNSISNGNMFLLSSRLAFLTGNTTYSDWAKKSYDWSKSVGLISDDFQVFDGTDNSKNCSEINHLQWTNNLAIYAEGSAIMYNLTNGSSVWNEATRGLVNASSVFVRDNVLTEVACELNDKCGVDQSAFKSGAVRSLARAALVAPFVSESVRSLLEASAKGAAKNCKNDGSNVQCTLSWRDAGSDSKSATTGLGENTNALSVVKALLWSNTKAIAPGNGTIPIGSDSTGNPSGTSGADLPETTGAAGTVTTSLATAFIVAFAAALAL